MIGASAASITGAARFKISIHANKVARLIAQHVINTEYARKQSHPAPALGQQAEAPDPCVAPPADHRMVVDRNVRRHGGRLDLSRHVDVVA